MRITELGTLSDRDLLYEVNSNYKTWESYTQCHGTLDIYPGDLYGLSMSDSSIRLDPYKKLIRLDFRLPYGVAIASPLLQDNFN